MISDINSISKPDISSKTDIKLIITTFYDKLLKDDEMFPFFEDIIQKNQLEHHLDVITNFWNDILFNTTDYRDNVMQKHLTKHSFVKFEKAHFAIWISYFTASITAFFNGENAERMKGRAQSIAMVMQVKMNLYSN